MKKLLGIVVLGLLLSGNVYAENLKFTKIINLDKLVVNGKKLMRK